MKKLLRLGTYIIAVFVLFSCSTNEKSPLTAVPGDAGFVAVFDGKSLSQKSGVQDFTQTKAYTTMLEELSPEEAQHLNQYAYILKDVNESGVGVNDEFMVFVTAKNQQIMFGFDFPVKDRTKLDALMKKLVDDSQKELVIAEDAGVSTMLLPDDEGVFCWNDNQLLILAGESMEDTDLSDKARSLINQDAGASIQSNGHFAQFYKNKKDISFWLDYSIIENSMPPAQQMMMGTSMPFNMNGMYMSAYAEFKNGEIVISYESELSPQMKEYMAKYPVIKDKFDLDALKVLPEESYLNIEIALDFYQYYRLIAEIYKEKQMNIDQYSQQLEQQIGMSMEDLLKGISGEIAFNAYGIQMTEKEHIETNFVDGELVTTTNTVVEPSLLYAGVLRFADEKVWMLLDDKIKEMGLQPDQNGIYQIPNTDIWFVYSEDNLVFTDDQDLINEISENGKIEPNLASGDVAGHLKEYPSYMEMNLDIDRMPQEVVDFYKNKAENAQMVDQIFEYLSVYKTLKVMPTSKTSAKIVLELKDDSKNSLEVILESFDKAIGTISQK